MPDCTCSKHAWSPTCPKHGNQPLRTKTGRILTDEEIEALAAEAERGYDISQIQDRFRRGDAT